MPSAPDENPAIAQAIWNIPASFLRRFCCLQAEPFLVSIADKMDPMPDVLLSA
jgi:hypothetical protein